MTHSFLRGALAVVTLFTFLAPAVAQDYQAQTTSTDAKLEIETNRLDAWLTPLDKAQLEFELAAWIDVCKAKANEVKEQTLAGNTDQVVTLKAQLDALKSRTEVVVTELVEKGGDAAEAQAYLSAVTGGLPDLSGVDAAWSWFTAWIVNPDGGLRLLTNIGLFLLFLIAFKILAGILGKLVGNAVARMKDASDLLRAFLVNTVRKVTFFIGLIIALSYLGVNIGPFVAAIGAAGFVIGFALQGTLQNFASGVMILIYRPYDIGDVVTASGVTGKVDSMNLVSTVVKTPDNQSVVVPNGSIWGDVITNVTANPTRRVDMTFGIGYGDDINKAEKILEEIVNKHELVLKDPVPVIMLTELADSSVNFVCRPWANTGDYWTVYWDVTRAVKERFDQEGISIPYPQQDVHMYQHQMAS